MNARSTILLIAALLPATVLALSAVPASRLRGPLSTARTLIVHDRIVVPVMIDGTGRSAFWSIRARTAR
jgi:hypothetical protein